MLTQGLSYRAAHDIVARLVTAHEATGGPDGKMRPELVDKYPMQYSVHRLSQVLDADMFVESRTSAGGTSQSRRKELAVMASDDLHAHQDKVAALLDGVDRAQVKLLRDAAAFVEERSDQEAARRC